MANKYDASSQIKEITLWEGIRLRPRMYIGSLTPKGIYNMIEYLIIDLIDHCKLSELTIRLCEGNRIEFLSDALSTRNLVGEMQNIRKGDFVYRHDEPSSTISLGLMFYLSQIVTCQVVNSGVEYMGVGNFKGFKFKQNATNLSDRFVLEFTPDNELFESSEINFLYLNHFVSHFAFLSPSLKIVTEDNRAETQRMVHYFPNGISDRLDILLTDRLINPPMYKVDVKKSSEKYKYDISIAVVGYELEPCIESYADYCQTLSHGSLIDGIKSGILASFRKNKLDYYREISDNFFKDEGFVIVASVIGKNFSYCGSTKAKLNVKELESEVAEIVEECLDDYFKKI